MKPAILNRDLECDDGIFNVRWWEDHPKIPRKDCEWKVMGGRTVDCPKKAEFWCQECGLVMCKGHRKGHSSSAQHRVRMEKWGVPSPDNGAMQE